MDINDLDEAQGLTAEMVRDYLRSTGWRLEDHQCIGWVKTKFGDAGSWIPESPGLVFGAFDRDHAVESIARQENRTIQAVLRTLNSRMRKGPPSDAAVRAHQGDETRAAWWLAHDQHGNLRVGIWTKPLPVLVKSGEPPFMFYVHRRGYLTTETVKDWSFWPCDENGNKVRWPTDAQGVML